MKIDGLDPLKNRPGGKPEKTEPVRGEPFEKVLKKVSGEAGKTSAPRGPAGPAPVTPLFLSGESGARLRETAGRLEDLLTDLSMFANALGDMNLPVERLNPMVDELEERKEEIALMIGELPDGELKDIASEALSILIEQVSFYHAGYAA
ncbi:MAG: hypothetical protein ACNS63_02625 [Candidatus Nitrospinota bacterium M3_3B_026]